MRSGSVIWQKLLGSIAGVSGLRRDRRGSVALWVAMMAPVLSGALSLGIEVSRWSTIQVDTQRTADDAALAGAIYYNANSGLANLAQNAAIYAARTAELNGATGVTSTTWTAGTKTLTDNQVTVQITTGVVNASDVAVKVTVTKPVSVILAGLISSLQSVTVTASSWSEISTTTSSSGPQPCMLALGGSSNGITTGTDIGLSGSVNITGSSCSIRSDAGISMSGSVNINAGGVYAGGNITTSGSVSITGGQYPNDGQIGDPYASDTALQNALSTANSASGNAISCSGSSSCTGTGVACSGGHCVLQPGTYSSITVSGSTNLTFNPGLYTVSGNISFSGSTSVTGNKISIIMGAGSGSTHPSLDTSGSTVLGLTAAQSSDVSGCSSNCAIPGVLFASQSTGTSAFSGSSGLPFTGLVYYPNGNLTFSGSSSDGSTGCAELIASTITLSGSANLAANCSSYGTKTFGSAQTASTVVSLVQ